MVSVRHFLLDSLLTVFLAIAILVSLSLPCSHLITAFLDRYYPPPPPRLASTIADEDGWRLDRESKHFIYYTQPGRGIPTWAVELNELTYARVTKHFSVTVPKIKYYRYNSQTDLQQAFGRPRKGYTYQTEEGSVIHSIYSCHPHEVIHAITYSLDVPLPFLKKV
jgi:hypothetical protein